MPGTTLAPGDLESLHRAYLASSLDAVVLMDADGRVLEFNPAAERTFGHARADVVGRDMGELLVPPALRERHRAGLRAHLAEGRRAILGRRIEITALHADGHELPVELTITRTDAVDGGVVFTGHIRDITDRKRAEAELRRSRGRLVAAADEARRRLERDLHDGAQQRLVALSLDVRVARGLATRDPEAAARMLDEVGESLRGAIAELRDLARGIHPAVLTQQGLGPALATLVRRCPVPVTVHAVPAERLPPPVEASAYFLVAEALTNAARHARATRVDVTLRREDGLLRVEVADDGDGGASADGGSGLRGLADRLAALDGTLEVVSPPGGGTLVRGCVPCAP